MKKASEVYRFEDFTILNYVKILELAKKEFRFIFFDESSWSGGKAIILRHDVEFSVSIALRMARIEAKLGIFSTFFIQLHGDFYNVLEKGTYEQIKEIEKLGHRLGLHFDVHFWNITREDDLPTFLLKDIATFENYFNEKPYAFSFHNNNAATLAFDSEFYCGIINVYSKKFKEDFGYCTDSTGFWRYEILENRIIEGMDQILQVLIHDGMWQDDVLPPRRRIYKIIDEHGTLLKRSYDNTLKNFGAKNIDWDGEI
jgi:hypothetical protein